MGLKIFFGEGGGGRGGGRLEELTFKILKAFLFYYCAHSANINRNCNSRGGGGLLPTDVFLLSIDNDARIW